MTRRFVVLTAVLALLLTACDPGAREAEPFAGIWRSEGWGMFLLVEGGEVEIFEHSEIHCLSVAAGGARGIADVLSLDGEGLVMRDSDREIRFEPIDVLPSRCADASGSPDPEQALAVLAATLDEQMVRPLDPDWAARLAVAAVEAVDADVTALLDVMSELVAPLGGSVRIATGDGGIVPPPLSLEPPPGIGRELDGAAASGSVGEGVAYLGLERIGPFHDEVAESESLLVSLVDEALGSPAVIIDLRWADGGVLGHALLAATRFVGEATTIGSMEARAGEGFVPAGDLPVTPVPTGVYPGETFVLIGPGTRGVAEVLALALASSATLVGMPTAGDPGPPLIRFLPNGWSLSVPNLRVRDASGRVVSAVEPDVRSDDPLAEAVRLAG